MRILVFIIALIISFIWDANTALIFYFVGRIVVFIIRTIWDLQPQPQADYGEQNNQGNYNSYNYKQNESKEEPKVYYDGIDKYYAVLGIRSTATNDEVKRAYRDMVRKYHPDMVSTQGESVQRTAERKTQEINEAYQNIKSWRNMN